MHSCTFRLCKLLEKRLFALHQNNCPENTVMKIHGRFWLFSWLYFQKILERNATACYVFFCFFKFLNTLQFFWNRKKITKAMVLQRPDALWKELFLKTTSFSRIRSILGSYITWVFDLQHANLLKKYPFIICIIIQLNYTACKRSRAIWSLKKIFHWKNIYFNLIEVFCLSKCRRVRYDLKKDIEP